MSSSAVPNSGPAVPAAPSVRRSGLTWWKALVTGAVGAAVVNLIVLAAAKLAGASLIVVDGGEEHLITVGGVIGASVVPLVVGTGAALLMALWKPVFLRIAQYVGGGLALLSVSRPAVVRRRRRHRRSPVPHAHHPRRGGRHHPEAPPPPTLSLSLLV